MIDPKNDLPSQRVGGGTILSDGQGQSFCEIRIRIERRDSMKILMITAIIALPLMAFGQTTEPQQTTQGQSKETQAQAPAKKKMPAAQEQSKAQAKPETGANVREKTDVESRVQDANRNESGARSSTSQ